MELTREGKSKARAFRRQAARNLYMLNAIQARALGKPTQSRSVAEQTEGGEFTLREYQEMNHDAHLATLSLLAAVLAYIDPEFSLDDYTEEFGTPSRSDN